MAVTQTSYRFLLVLQVTLVVPWLAQADQIRVFPNSLVFKEPSEQEACMREWITHRTGASLACPTREMQCFTKNVSLTYPLHMHICN